MPNIKSAKKRVLISAARQARNKAARTSLKTVLKKARAIDAAQRTQESLKEAQIKLDKAVSKGIIHKNKAARLKSRLSKNPA